MAIVLNQIINYSLNTNLRDLYYKAKVYELLSLYFNRGEDVNAEQCPFLADESNVIKIKAAKDIIIQRISEPPTLAELSSDCLLYTSPSPRDRTRSRMPSSA